MFILCPLAASTTIFERIKLPETDFDMHYLEWETPFDNGYLQLTRIKQIKNSPTKSCLLIGVSLR
jgi:hypothetical protein